MIAADLPGSVWRKSSRSGSDSNCVEVAGTPDSLAVRDSKDPEGPVLLFPHAAWTTFITAVHNGAFDHR